MILFDVNVLVAAHRPDHEHHDLAVRTLTGAIADGQALALTSAVTVGFVRVVTHPRVFVEPTRTVDALEFVRRLAALPQALRVEPGPSHWRLLSDLCAQADIKGPLLTDAHLAAVAVESGSTLVSFDRDFARFAAVRWRHPRDAA